MTASTDAGQRPLAADSAVPPRALFDVNVLIALLDRGHIHHDRAREWLLTHQCGGWASCAITQNGCIRIMSQPAYPGSLPAAEVAARLRRAMATPLHRFVAQDLSLTDARRFDTSKLLGPRQVTDVYLLGLAVANAMRLVTFDPSIPPGAVADAQPDSLVVL